ncbi:MAG: NPCBM/NEW2 domain-containing protein [Planctomycetota bacterium]|nr:NPCBM/NEW2 domain-containing protein [Planctomycetota bacterium]
MRQLVVLMTAAALGLCCMAAGEETRLGDLAHLELVKVGWGKPTKDKAVSGQPIQMAGEKFEHGLGVHAPSLAAINLDGKAETFHAVVGVNDLGKSERGSVEFIVRGDGKALFKSGLMQGGDNPKTIDVALTGVKQLKLEVTDGGDGISSDHANWADAVFTWKGTAPILTEAPDSEAIPEETYPPLEKLVKSPGGTTYFVDPASGNDENSGTQADKPWRSLKMVNRLLLASGDRIELKPGAFAETLRPSGEGTVTQPIVIQFAPGEYDFHPEDALKLTLHISNTNDAPKAPKAIALAFQGIRHVQVLGGAEGKKSDLYMRGKMIQTFFDHAEDIRLNGLAFDYRRPTTSEYTVVDVAADHADLAIHKDSKYAIENGRMVWVGEGWRHNAFQQLQQQGDTSEGTLWRDGIRFGDVSKIEELSAGNIRVHFFRNPGFVKGRVWQERDPFRACTGSFARNSKDITWVNCSYHYMHGMGLVNQFCENLTLRKVELSPRPGSGRTCACWADSIQVSGCRGKFIAEECTFSGTQDDPINVHGTHLRIVGRPAADQLLVRFCHGQTYGFEAFFARDDIDFVHANSLRIFASGNVKKAEMKGEREMLLTLEKPAPDGILTNDVIENVTWTPEVEICNCKIEMCSTRGFLLTTRRKVLVEDNTFTRTAMSAILVSNDARSWFESGPVRDMTIRRNRFIRCGIDIWPENSSAKPEEPVHENVRIEGNLFHNAGINARSVKGLVVVGNKFTSGSIQLRTQACTDVTNENNSVNAKP